MHPELTAPVVPDDDEAIRFFVDVLGSELVEDSPATMEDGSQGRRFVVRPPHAPTGLLPARAAGERRTGAIGDQCASRVGWLLRTTDLDEFEAVPARLVAHGVEIVRPARDEPDGRVAVFVDVAGKRWDLLGTTPEP